MYPKRGGVVTDPGTRNGTLGIVGIAGSLRRRSYNRLLLCAAQRLAPPSVRIEIETLADVPLFNEDEEIGGPPEAVVRLRRSVKAAHGLLLVTPEYNHGVPGVMKNAIDWLSQPLHCSVLENKPTGIMGASTGLAGTARGQAQLRQAFVLTNTPTMLRPEVLVGRVHEKFDTAGNLTDEPTIRFLSDFLLQFGSWVHRQLRALETDPRDGC
jgi:chromate reductase, NAD(P)H dehydrogenase (quinone)